MCLPSVLCLGTSSCQPDTTPDFIFQQHQNVEALLASILSYLEQADEQLAPSFPAQIYFSIDNYILLRPSSRPRTRPDQPIIQTKCPTTTHHGLLHALPPHHAPPLRRARRDQPAIQAQLLPRSHVARTKDHLRYTLPLTRRSRHHPLRRRRPRLHRRSRRRSRE